MAKKTNKTEKVVASSTPAQIYIPSGVTLIDLACTDTVKGFCSAGHTVNIIGDRNSGKSILCLASMAETYHRHKDLFKYDYYDYERAVSFNVAKLFGNKFAKKLNHIEPDNDEGWAIENLRVKILESLKKGPRYIVIDSIDVMKPIVEVSSLYKETDGKKTMGTERAKAITAFFRSICPAIADSGSFLIAVSQARDNIGVGAMFTPKVRSGGRALGYYAYIEMWLAPGPQIKTGDVKVGQWTMAKIERSKYNGKKRTVSFPILPAYGIDDTRGNIDWLLEEGVIKKVGKRVVDMTPIGVEYEGDNPYLFVEENGEVMKVLAAVKERWDHNERILVERTFEGRKGRYE